MNIIKVLTLIIIVPIIISLALYFVIFPAIEGQNVNQIEEILFGKWESTLDNITIIFYENRTCIVYNNNIKYLGPWTVDSKLPNYITLNWEGFQAVYLPLFDENFNQVMLVGHTDGSHSVELNKS